MNHPRRCILLVTLLLIFLLPFFSISAQDTAPVATPDLTSTPGSKVVVQVVADTAKFYYGPGFDYPVLYTIKKSGKIQVFGMNEENTWYVFSFNKGRAWIHAGEKTVKVIEGDSTTLPLIEAPKMPTPTPTKVPTATRTPAPATTILYALGTPIVRVTLLEYHFSYGKDYSTPRPGFTYLIARIKVENLSYSPTWYTSAFEFKVLDGKGSLKSTDFIKEAYDCRLEIVELLVGGEAEGCLGFEVSQFGSLSIVYAPFQYARYGNDRAAVFKVR